MPAARFWRLSQIEPDAKLALDLRGLELWDVSARIDQAATFTCTATPVSGTLAALQDGDTATGCAFSVADSNAGGFMFMWDFGVGITVSVRKVKLWSSTSVTTSPRGLSLEISVDGLDWLPYATLTSLTALAAGSLVEVSIPELGGALLVSTYASSYNAAGKPEWDVTATTDRMWPINFGDTSTFGVFSYANTTTAVAATTPTAAAVISRFNMDDVWNVLAYSGFQGATDYCYIDVEFLTAADVVKAAISLKTKAGGVFCGYYVGATIASATQSSSGSANSTVSGTVAFTPGGITFTYTNLNGVTFACDLSQVTKLRVSNVRSNSGYVGSPSNPGHAEAYIRIRSTVQSGNNASSSVIRGYLLEPTVASWDIQGSTGRIAGTVKLNGSPDNLPLRRRVRLYSTFTTLLVRETWSDPITGAYSFDHIDISFTYDVISTDHTGAHRAVIADNITPELMP